MWVADMDFPCAQEITDALAERCRHGIFGYNLKPKEYYQSIHDFYLRRHGLEMRMDRMLYTPGIVPAIHWSLLCYTQPGDGVTILTPVYGPFAKAVNITGRTLYESPLVNNDGHYEIDFADLDEKLSRSKVLLFCSPHNPVSRVWTRPELERVAELCQKHDVLVISDEIHADLSHPSSTHIPMGKANEGIGADVITFMAPSKTFNLAGEHAGFAVFSNEEMFGEFTLRQRALRLTTPGYTIKQLMSAAYLEGYEYNQALCLYLENTVKAMRKYLEKECPELKLANSEASFVTFLDCSAVYNKIEKKVLSEPEKYRIAKGGGILSPFFGVEAAICMNDGTWFGPSYKEYVRLNYGTSRAFTMNALERIVKAVKAL